MIRMGADRNFKLADAPGEVTVGAPKQLPIPGEGWIAQYEGGLTMLWDELYPVLIRTEAGECTVMLLHRRYLKLMVRGDRL